ncbi:uncharacterized protein DSM5745_09841 [Aspergillus mulundensis]|uniref:Copper transporter n=1 Tax=Aspergillus mulundensis TaxID=1810919 RepID=A0A3D8QS05_9EURO|nr:hypothetical protein DSM5745_09841 [Aspergillus mulundensis]RDW64430.1 hypothetical protein DSM5745_09841 [Aspergillus mulundensis]
MPPATARAKKSPRPATDYERWLGDDDQTLDSVRRYDTNQSADDRHDTDITVTGESDSPALVRSNHDQPRPNTEPGPLPILPDDSPQSGRHYPRPTVPDFVALYAALIIAILLVRRLHIFLRRSLWERRLICEKEGGIEYTDGETIEGNYKGQPATNQSSGLDVLNYC